MNYSHFYLGGIDNKVFFKNFKVLYVKGNKGLIVGEY